MPVTEIGDGFFYMRSKYRVQRSNPSTSKEPKQLLRDIGAQPGRTEVGKKKPPDEEQSKGLSEWQNLGASVQRSKALCLDEVVCHCQLVTPRGLASYLYNWRVRVVPRI